MLNTFTIPGLTALCIAIFATSATADIEEFLPGIMPESYEGKSLAVAIPYLSINYDGTVETEFGPGEPNQLISHFVDSAMVKVIGKESFFSNITSFDYGDIDFSDASFPDADEVTFYKCATKDLPRDKDVLLIIGPFTLKSETQPTMLGFSRTLVYSVSYVFQDAKSGRMIAYGSFEDEVEGMWSIKIKEWIDLVENITDDIIVDEFEKK